MPNKIGNEVTCSYCKYTWKVRSKKAWISCPNCLQKTRNRNINKDSETYIDMDKKTTVKFVANGRVLKKYPVVGFKRGETEFIKESLSRTENIPKDFIEIQID